MRIVSGVLLALLTGAAGCDVLSPPATQYLAAPECGAAQAVSPPAELARWPVLQAMTATAATVTWGVRDDAPARVRYGHAYARLATASELGTTMIDGEPLRLVGARLTGLAPGARTCYEIVAGDKVLAAGLALRSATSATDATIRFNVIGDYGAGSWAQRRVRKQLERQPADLLLTTGDNAYPAGTFDQFEANVFQVYRATFTQTPVFPVPGNHDYKTDDARPYLTEFVLPENAWRAADKERYYSFDWGPVHFVALDSERPLQETSLQAADDMADWLDADLARNVRPWAVVYLHRPPYTASKRHEGSAKVQRILVPIFEKHRVRLVLAGHNHVYERFRPRNGVTYVTTGGAGATAYPTGAAPDLAVTSADYHFVALQADACTLAARVINASGDVIDKFQIRRCDQ